MSCATKSICRIKIRATAELVRRILWGQQILAHRKHSFQAFAHLDPSWAVRIGEALGGLLQASSDVQGFELKQP